MGIFKIIGIGIVSLVLIIIIKQYRPEFAIYISLLAGLIILTMSLSNINEIINLINEISYKVSINNKYLLIIFKVTGIAILSEFAISVCIDAGEKAIANKIDLGGKIIIISMSIPIISGLLETILNVL